MAAPAVEVSACTYGKSRVRVVKNERGPTQHKLQEFTVQLLIEGDFDSSFSRAENHKVIPTDTQKNICYVVAHDHDFSSIEEYGIALTQHMLQNYSWVTKATATVLGAVWQRMTIDGKPHPFSFRRAPYQRYALVSSTRAGGLSVFGGIRDYTVLKTTESGFIDYPKCKHTTLKPTTDRFLSTAAEITWRFNAKKKADAAAVKRANPEAVAEAVLSTFDYVFATEYSPSVQATIWTVAVKALEKISHIEDVSFRLPNIHVLTTDLGPLGIKDNKTVFIPTNDPHGDIAATVSRKQTKPRL